MFLSPETIARSVERLQRVHPFFGISFLAFKQVRLPVGTKIPVVFTQIADRILNRYYRPARSSERYFHPFQTSDKANRWVTTRYGSTSLQRITADTFGDCFLHIKKTSEWGWKHDYVHRLATHLGEGKVPLLDLGVWLYRSDEWASDTGPADVARRVIRDFDLSVDELSLLFESDGFGNPAKLTGLPTSQNWLRDDPITEGELFEIIGWPPGADIEEGSALRYLEFCEVGPSHQLRYEPSERLNIITGDNSLGKTFLLETAWWALTGEWLESPALPRRDVPKSAAKIEYGLSTASQHAKGFTTKYNWELQAWCSTAQRQPLSGLVLYARHDGSFAVWDPARARLNERTRHGRDHVFFTRHQIWNGLSVDAGDNLSEWICNGLIRDWVSWQTAKGPRYDEPFHAFIACLKSLSPPHSEPLVPGEPMRLAPDAREIPTLRMSYDEVPVTHTSAGVQRVLALAYLLVWTWFEHLSFSQLMRKDPQRRLVLIIDEVEAHLHPKWQRAIIPALMDVLKKLAPSVAPQVHLATHSPLVMASAETVFDEKIDDLHHLKLVNGFVELEELPFNKRGRADVWLISEVFGLAQARSLPAEKAIERAKSLQMEDDPDPVKIREAHNELVRCLAQDDEFWPRWTFFATQHGVKI